MNQRGFSLLELMVALTILAIALIPISYFYTKSLQNAEQSGIRTRALELAWERVNEIRALAANKPGALQPNTRPTSNTQKILFGPDGLAVFDYAGDAFGYDFANPGANALHPAGQWAGMFRYPLPLDFNPYDPRTLGYNNAPNANHFVPNNPTADPHVNFNTMVGNFNGGLAPLDYEYEPIGFYGRIFQRNSLLSIADAQDIRMADARTITSIEPALVSPNAANRGDYFRSGNEQQVDNYSIYGRRTILMAYAPRLSPDPQDPNSRTRDDDTDGLVPSDPADGGASAVAPFTLTHGPADKFVSIDSLPLLGPGMLVTVIVFWLPRNAPEAYVPYNDLNKIEVKVHVASDGSMTALEDGRTSNIVFDPSPFFITHGS